MTEILKSCATAALFVIASVLTATAAPKLSSTQQDWSVFTDTNPTECWAVTAPVSSVATKAGKTVSVQRGEIGLFVTYRRGAQSGEISFRGGYPFAAGSQVTMALNSGAKFTLFTQGEGAWPNTPADDAKILAALKGAGTAVVTGTSARGTMTTDKMSLIGVTAATDAARGLCR